MSILINESYVNDTTPLWASANATAMPSGPLTVTSTMPILVFANSERIGQTFVTGDYPLIIQSIVMPVEPRAGYYLIQAEYNFYADGATNIFYPMIYEEVNGNSINIGPITGTAELPWHSYTLTWKFYKDAEGDAPQFSQIASIDSLNNSPSAYGTMSIWFFPEA